ncbi:MAG: hypothetical protein R3D26_11580 [Cyanobacteriota/Melainabacteria group bacterium]
MHKLSLFDLAEGDLEGAESTEKQSLSILEKELTMNDLFSQRLAFARSHLTRRRAIS